MCCSTVYWQVLHVLVKKYEELHIPDYINICQVRPVTFSIADITEIDITATVKFTFSVTSSWTIHAALLNC